MAQFTEIQFIPEAYGCAHCPYQQDFDPTDAAKMAEHLPGFPVGVCPNCVLGKRGFYPMARILDPAEIIFLQSIASDEGIEQVADAEQLSKQKKQALYEQRDEQRDTLGSVAVKEVTPEDQEVAALKEQRDRDLDALEPFAVQDVG